MFNTLPRGKSTPQTVVDFANHPVAVGSDPVECGRQPGSITKGGDRPLLASPSYRYFFLRFFGGGEVPPVDGDGPCSGSQVTPSPV
jgi:hypothetical protein